MGFRGGKGTCGWRDWLGEPGSRINGDGGGKEGWREEATVNSVSALTP